MEALQLVILDGSRWSPKDEWRQVSGKWVVALQYGQGHCFELFSLDTSVLKLQAKDPDPIDSSKDVN